MTSGAKVIMLDKRSILESRRSAGVHSPMKMPPLNPLHVFSIVAQQKSLLATAQVLGVTQSAVSRQISALEDFYGCKLFKRKKYGLEVLPIAEELAKEAASAFEAIEKKSENFKNSIAKDINEVKIKTYTSFAGNWLIPNLGEFFALYPEIRILIKTGAKSIDFKENEGDLSIQIIKQDKIGCQSTLLFEDTIEPVCSPDFLKKYAPNPKYPFSILRQSVIKTDYRDFDWNTWIEKCGYEEDYRPQKTLNFANALLAWDAAANGVGVAMGQTILLKEKIRSKRLITPFNMPIKTGMKYYVILPEKNVKRGALIFKDWLLKKFSG